MLSHLTFFIGCSISFRPSFRLYVAAMQWRSACNVPVWVTMSSHSHPVLRYALKHVNFLEVSSPPHKSHVHSFPLPLLRRRTRDISWRRDTLPHSSSPGLVPARWGLCDNMVISIRPLVCGWLGGMMARRFLPILLSIFLYGYVHIHAVYVRGKAAPTPETRISIEVR